MPIYEYKCSECGAHFEKMQKVSEEPLSVCEVCGGKLEKQWSLSGFQFKGAGWYVTDYSNKLKETGAGKSDKSDKAEKSESAVKSDNSEKSSPAESTAKTESASNTVSDTAASSKKETTVKKD
jgi:putative FmdB family regulatory protein